MNKAIVSLLVLIGICAASHVSARSYDIVIQGGRVMDPETGLDAVRNVGILDNTIARVSSEPLQGVRMIDARGFVVAPGFMELFQHAHDPESYRLNALDGVTSSLDLEVLDGGVLNTKEFAGHALLNYGTSAGHGASRQALFDASISATVPAVARFRGITHFLISPVSRKLLLEARPPARTASSGGTVLPALVKG
jgi:hypothetical protein